MAGDAGRQWTGRDGTVNATYELHDVETSTVEAIFGQSSASDRESLPAYVAKWRGQYMVFVEGKTVGFAPVKWTRLDHRINQGPVPGTVELTRLEGEGVDRLLISVHLRDL